ncbi:MAG: hypothetical protein ROZ37_01265 [Aromatoleum sp.]|jgi:hypothetical protein|uniref:hypothetical protein n=1 Tax=Aromatoleum sp. TaxID=2307007 RepID=UPI002895FD93|nr:hypothetical protein [Aromatoleum sp.]MDT3668945.1 hypothetical protein [Aromatoleum sp.]
MSRITPPRPGDAAANSHPAAFREPITQADGEWIMTHGSRAQRRNGLRQLKALVRQGVSGAADVLADLLAEQKGGGR